MRVQYSKGVLDENQVDKNPLRQMHLWLADALEASCPEPTAMILSTAGTDLKPSSRVVLMKGLDERGILFFTNYESRKGQQLVENQNASLLFFWPSLERQVRIEGTVGKVSTGESDTYFDSRPAASRISAVVSPQSREIPEREWLEDRWREAAGNEQMEAATRPKNWGGYLFVPDYFEFWQGREDRLHDRIICQRMGEEWRMARLAP